MPLINVREQKFALRAKHKKLRKTCPQEVRCTLDNALTTAFLESDEYKKCRILFAFVSSPIEVSTVQIIDRALSDGKRLAVPKCTDKSGIMDFYYINSTDCLQEGCFSIMEPNPQKCEKVTDFTDGLCIVPGLCFDLQGYRLGFGKGYYDRFLQNFGGITVGLCYSRCVEKQLPTGNFDRPVDILITEKYINYTNNVFGKE